MDKRFGFSLKDALNAFFRKSFIFKACVVIAPLSVFLVSLCVKPIYETDAAIAIELGPPKLNPTAPPSERPSLGEPTPAALLRTRASEKEILRSVDLWTLVVQEMGTAYFADNWRGSLPGPIARFIRSDHDASRKSVGARPAEVDAADPGYIAKELLKGFRVGSGDNSHILALRFRYHDPEKARRILSTLLRVYLSSLAARDEMQSSHASPPRLKKAPAPAPPNRELETAYADLLELLEDPQLSALIERSEALEERGDRIRAEAAEVDAAISRVRSALESVEQGELPTGLMTSGSDAQYTDDTIAAAAGRYRRAVSQHAEISREYVETSREFRDSTAELEARRAELIKSLAAHLRSLGGIKSTLETNLASIRSASARIAAKPVELARLRARIEAAAKRSPRPAVRENIPRKAAAEAPKSERSVSARVLSEPHTPASEIYPKRGWYTLIAFLLSIPLGLCLVALADYFDHTFDTPQDVRSITGYEVLASLRRTSMQTHRGILQSFRGSSGRNRRKSAD